MKIIFIHPTILDNATSGSRLRPFHMLKAFKNLGYEVYDVFGKRKEREKKYEEIAEVINSGMHIDYVYVESLSRPTNSKITKIGGVKLMRSENLDFNFIEFCLKNKIPVGYFLRDLHWDFKEHLSEEHIAKRVYLKNRLRKYGKLELDFLKQDSIKVFSPSEAFGKYLYKKWGVKSSPLPPGSKSINSHTRNFRSDKIKLFYVGGVVGIYDPRIFLEGVLCSDQCEITLCVRKEESEFLSDYKGEKNIFLVSGYGPELQKYYMNADIAVYPLPPHGYARFAYSVKISEYIANGLPIIAFEGSYIASFILENNIGWIIPYQKESVPELISEIKRNPDDYNVRQKNVLEMQKEIEWEHVIVKIENELFSN